MHANRVISQQEFEETARALSAEAKVLDTLHAYFVQHSARIYQTCRWFGLFENKLGDVLEIGPFFSYTPFVVQSNASSYTVLEGDDPAAYLLQPLYEKRKIALQFVDLFEMFGPTRTSPHTLPFGDGSFDSLLCWGTMEHFNFNPVKFVRELHRVLRPRGRAYIQVPNKASFQNITALLTGRLELSLIDSFYAYEDYVSNGKKAFYGFHWREFTRPELSRLFSRAGFGIASCEVRVSFQHARTAAISQRMLRLATRVAAGLFPRFGTDVCLIGEKGA